MPRAGSQRGGWLLVDRVTGRVSQLNLPEFDPFYSTAAWYRDYVAYCGVSEDGKKLYAMVAQVGRRKPVLKKDVGQPAGADDPDSECPPPAWERSPARVTFQPDAHAEVGVLNPGTRGGCGQRHRGRSRRVAPPSPAAVRVGRTLLSRQAWALFRPRAIRKNCALIVPSCTEISLGDSRIISE